MNETSYETTQALPKLLVSVRDADEVLAALAGGADWIDLKEPNAGPLAAVEVEVARKAVEVLARRRTMSAALGELCDWETSASRELLSVAEIGVVKLGLAGCGRLGDWQERWQAIFLEAAQHEKKMVAVVYADWQEAEAPVPGEILKLARRAGCQYLLVDTFDKSSGSVFDHLSRSDLKNLFGEAQQAGMTTVLAGSVTRKLVGQISFEEVDIIAVRGAVCQGNRTSGVDAGLIETFRQSLLGEFA